MASKRERHRISSSIDELPVYARDQLNARLANTSVSYQEIADELTAMGHEISRSAVGRYALRHNATMARLKAAREQTDALMQFVRDNQDVEATEAASAILIDALTRRIATAEEEFDELPIDKAGKLLIQVQRSTIYKERWRKERRAITGNIERKIMAEVRQVLQGKPELLAQLAQIVKDVTEQEAVRGD